MHRQVEIEEKLDPRPEFNTINTEKAESFKDFHQDERKARTMKWPWFSFEVDYGYFTFRPFRKHYWPKIQLGVLLFYILPVLYYTLTNLQKKHAEKCTPFPIQNSSCTLRRRSRRLSRPKRTRSQLTAPKRPPKAQRSRPDLELLINVRQICSHWWSPKGRDEGEGLGRPWA
jgi:hypothetical protein